MTIYECKFIKTIRLFKDMLKEFLLGYYLRAKLYTLTS